MQGDGEDIACASFDRRAHTRRLLCMQAAFHPLWWWLSVCLLSDNHVPRASVDLNVLQVLSNLIQQPYNVGTIISRILKTREPKFRMLSNLSKTIQLVGLGFNSRPVWLPSLHSCPLGCSFPCGPACSLPRLSHHGPRSLPPCSLT